MGKNIWFRTFCRDKSTERGGCETCKNIIEAPKITLSRVQVCSIAGTVGSFTGYRRTIRRQEIAKTALNFEVSKSTADFGLPGRATQSDDCRKCVLSSRSLRHFIDILEGSLPVKGL